MVAAIAVNGYKETENSMRRHLSVNAAIRMNIPRNGIKSKKITDHIAGKSYFLMLRDYLMVYCVHRMTSECNRQ